MTMQSLFLAWQDKGRPHETRKWFPIGRLDVEGNEKTLYQFRYTKGAFIAHHEVGFAPLADFPDFKGAYESSELFPLFKNRIISSSRPDFREYLRQLDLSEAADPIEILTVGGGYRATDSFEVFPKLMRKTDGSFDSRFFLHGWRHVNKESQGRIDSLSPNENLYVTLELTNPTGPAIQIETTDYFMIGWAPRYLVLDLMKAMVSSPGAVSARVVKVNPAPAPLKQRVLIELKGHWPKDYVPMDSDEYKPLVG